MDILKKVLLLLAILVIASLLFSTKTIDNSSYSKNEEIVEIIDKNSSSLSDGYVEVEQKEAANSNFFVKIVEFISQGVKKIIVAIFSIFGKLVSSIAG